MMKKLVQLTLLIMMSVVLSGCNLLSKTQPPKPKSETEQTKTSENPAAQNKLFNGPLKAAIDLGIPMKCTYKVGENESTGFIKGKQYYGEFTTQGKNNFVIIKNDCLWSWSKGETQGFKMCFKPEEGKSVWDQDQAKSETDYHCVPAVVTDAQFEPPAQVKFNSLDELMQKGMSSGEEQKQGE